jgi:hypothetical protein
VKILLGYAEAMLSAERNTASADGKADAAKAT